MSQLSLSEAQEHFVDILRKLSRNSVPDFLSWIECNWLVDTVKGDDSAETMLEAIAEDLQTSLPFEAVLPSENIIPPSDGKNADCDPEHTLHVDAFLYDDSQVDVLCAEGRLDRNYCARCGSRDIKPVTFISHSSSKERLQFIFKYLLPPLNGKVVLDIGSRIGAVLYGAYVYSQAQKIIGVEMNAEFCKLQRHIITKYKLQDRVEIIEADIMTQPSIIKTADIIVMNNVFEFFLTAEQQKIVWLFLNQTIKSGTLLVTVPLLEESLLKNTLSEWVERISMYNPDTASSFLNQEEMQEIGLYKVK